MEEKLLKRDESSGTLYVKFTNVDTSSYTKMVERLNKPGYRITSMKVNKHIVRVRYHAL